MIEEQRATREAVAIYDQSSFGKLLLQGRDALAVLQRLCANQIDMPVDRMVYTALLNERGGFESDLTVIRVAPESFLIVTGSAQPVRDADWIRRHIGAHEFAVLTDVSALWSVISVMGPKARELLGRVSPDDLSPEGLKFAHTREIDLGHARVRAARMSYVGGPGYELYVPVEMARHVYLALKEAGADLGLQDAGYYAIDALRIEAGRRAWGAELGPDETPFEAGLMFAVKLDKGCDFIGREALLRLRDQPLRKKLLTFVLDRPRRLCLGRRGHRHRRPDRGRTQLGGLEPEGRLPASAWAMCAATRRSACMPARRCRSTCGASRWRPRPGTSGRRKRTDQSIGHFGRRIFL